MKPYLKFGLIGGVAAIIYTLVMYLTEIDRSDIGKNLGWLMMIVFLIFVVLAIKEQRDSDGGYITFGTAFKTGFLTMLIGGLISTLYYLIHVSLIDPDMITFIRDKTADEMAMKNMPDEQIEIAMKYTNMFLTPGMMALFGFLTNVVSGAIFSLIIAAIMKKDRPQGEVTIQ